MNLKKTIINNLKYLVLGIALAVSLSYAYAAWGTPTGAYTDPNGSPTANNVATPLNVDADDQIKSGGTCIAGNCGGLSLGTTFLASENAEFDGQVFLNGIVGASANGVFLPSSAVLFGGTDSTGYVQPTSITISGGLNAAATLKSGQLANATGTQALCADQGGHIVFCNATDMCSNMPGVQTTVPPGDQQNSDGTCTAVSRRFLAKIPYQQYNDPNIVGGVVNGQTSQGGGIGGTLDAPLVDQIGFYNGTLSANNWIYNNLPGVENTDFSDNGSRLIDVGLTGSYDIKISSSGNISITGKPNISLQNQIGVDFYLKIVHKGGSTQWVRMDNNTTKLPFSHVAYPVATKTTSDFGVFVPDNQNVVGYAPYKITFDQTFQLNAGDTVDIYALIYGESQRTGLDKVDFANFYYGIDASNTTFDITES